MQFEFDIVPAAVGVGIFVSCQLLLRALARRGAKKPKESQLAAPPQKGAEPFEETGDDVEVTSEEEPEPVPEPAEEPEVGDSVVEAPVLVADDTPRRRVPTFLWRAFVVALVLSCAALLMSLSPLGLLQQQIQVASEVASEISSEFAGKPIDEVTSEEQAPVLFGPVPVAKDQDMGDGSAAFSVTLTRQVMNDANYVRSAYYGTLHVGMPAVQMTVVFDTGSGHLVLPSFYCKSATCKAHRRYRRSASRTARDVDVDGGTWQEGPRESLNVAFGTGEITGVYVEDRVCMSGVSNVSIEAANVHRPECISLSFIAATDLSEDPFKNFHFDGILGLGLSGLSQNRQFNFMEVMAQSIRGYNGRNPHMFGVYLGNHDFEDSEIALGGWARQHLREELSWGPIHDPELGHWIIPIRAIRVDNTRLAFCDDGNCRGAVDTGTSLLAVPPPAFREMYELLRHAPPMAGHCHGFGPLLHFELEHFTVSLGPKDYGQIKKTHRSILNKIKFFEGKAPKGRRDLRCTPMMMTLEMEEPIGPKLFVLGEPVLRKYYSVYDGYTKQIGLARARHTKWLSRDELLGQAPGVEPVSRQRLPTMFDVFRWRKALL